MFYIVFPTVFHNYYRKFMTGSSLIVRYASWIIIFIMECCKFAMSVDD